VSEISWFALISFLEKSLNVSPTVSLKSTRAGITSGVVDIPNPGPDFLSSAGARYHLNLGKRLSFASMRRRRCSARCFLLKYFLVKLPHMTGLSRFSSAILTYRKRGIILEFFNKI
jgi:hypothetical protein